MVSTALLAPRLIIATMQAHNCVFDTAPGCINDVYCEGVNPDGTVNDNAVDKWNDQSLLIDFVDGEPRILFQGACTTAPGIYYDRTHVINANGAAIIALGNHPPAWQFGYHHSDPDHPAWVQTGGPVAVHRDTSGQLRRMGNPVSGWYGINQHGTGGSAANPASIGLHSAGCLVRKDWSADAPGGHLRWVKVYRTDMRFLKDHKHVFGLCVLPASWLLATSMPAPIEVAPAPLPTPPPSTQADQTAIVRMASASEAARYSWDDRGQAPMGYIKGMALTFADVYRAFLAGDQTAMFMAKAETGNSASDALTYLRPQFAAKGMSNELLGPATLRHLWVLLLGLGMRESSGKYNEGRDASADNVSSNTAEAGLFQASWNFHTASALIDQLFAKFKKTPLGYIDTFREGVSGSMSSNYGSGDGRDFQALCKIAPAFAAWTAAVGLRCIRSHWGPINRKEAEITTEADRLFKDIQDYIERGNWVQAALNATGANPQLKEDGKIGPLTRSAIMTFQKAHSLMQTGWMDTVTTAALKAATATT